MTVGDALVDPRLWLMVFLVGTPMFAIELLVLRGADRIIDAIFARLRWKR